MSQLEKGKVGRPKTPRIYEKSVCNDDITDINQGAKHAGTGVKRSVLLLIAVGGGFQERADCNIFAF